MFSYSALPPIGTISFQKRVIFFKVKKILFLNIGSLIIKMSSTEKELNQTQKKRSKKNSKVKPIHPLDETQEKKETVRNRRIFFCHWSHLSFRHSNLSFFPSSTHTFVQKKKISFDEVFLRTVRPQVETKIWFKFSILI